MQNLETRSGRRQAAAVIGAGAVLLVGATVLLVPFFGASACFGWSVQECAVSWTSPAGVATSYPLWISVQLAIVAITLLFQALILRERSAGRGSVDHT